MHEYRITLTNGKVYTGFGYSEHDMGDALEVHGISRMMIADTRRISKHADDGTTPYISMGVDAYANLAA